MHRALLLAVSLTLVAGCTSSNDADGTTSTSSTTASSTSVADTTPPADNTVPVTTPAAERPYQVFVPSSYTNGTAAPLVILLHGYGATGDIQNLYLGVESLAERHGFLYVHPDGTKNALGDQFWNATDACCGAGLSTVDDVAYLTGIIDSVSAQYDVDPKRIYFMGHSNGGFMSYRMACELSDRVAAVASLAGATFLDTSQCTPSQPVSVLQVHGTADATIKYDGGITRGIGKEYPSAAATVAAWAAYNGCAGVIASVGTPLDLEANVAGAESQRTAYAGCPAGIDVQLITVQDGPHIPAVGLADGSHPLTEAMIDFLLAHPKP